LPYSILTYPILIEPKITKNNGNAKKKKGVKENIFKFKRIAGFIQTGQCKI